MELRVKVAQMTPRDNILFKTRLLGHKIRLGKKKPATTTICTARLTLEAVALSIESCGRPEVPFLDDLLHTLELLVSIVSRINCIFRTLNQPGMSGWSSGK
jgi:hypothetical protein